MCDVRSGLSLSLYLSHLRYYINEVFPRFLHGLEPKFLDVAPHFLPRHRVQWCNVRAGPVLRWFPAADVFVLLVQLDYVREVGGGDGAVADSCGEGGGYYNVGEETADTVLGGTPVSKLR